MTNIPWKNPQFVYYPDAYATDHFAHIATPEFVKRSDSLFQCNGETLCGSGKSRSETNGIGYHRSGAQHAHDLQPQYYDAPPEGVPICRQCLAHLQREYLPFVE
ncbi:MAG: hypothetical protein WC359_13350 [Dehalococcoidia bacterium]|jgi:hypothetical protein